MVSIRGVCPILSLWLAGAAIAQAPAATSAAPERAPAPVTAEPACDFDALPGREFRFSTADPVLRPYGFVLWKPSPSLFAEPLSYAEVSGRRGKLTGELIERDNLRWHVGFLDDCRPVYAEDASAHSDYDRQLHLELNGKIIFSDIEAAAEQLIGRDVIVQGPGLEPRQRLYTPERGRFHPLRGGDRLRVVGIDPHRYAHAKGVGPLFLEVQRPSGARGLIKFNPDYVRLPDGSLPLRSPRVFVLGEDAEAEPGFVSRGAGERVTTQPRPLGAGRGYLVTLATLPDETAGWSAVRELKNEGYTARLKVQPDGADLAYQLQVLGFDTPAAARAAGEALAGRYGGEPRIQPMH